MSERARFGLVIAIVLVVFGVAMVGLPHVPLTGYAAFCLSFVAVAIAALSVAAAAPTGPRDALYVAVPAIACFAASFAIPDERVKALLVAAALLSGATTFGARIGSAVKYAGYAIVIAAVSSCADLFSVLHDSGPSAQIAGSEVALSLVAISFPTAGTDRIDPVLGFGDLVIAGLYFALAKRHGLSMKRAFGAFALAFVTTLALLLVTERPIPVLPLLGIAFVLAFPEARDVPKDERKVALLGTLVVAAVFVALALFL